MDILDRFKTCRHLNILRDYGQDVLDNFWIFFRGGISDLKSVVFLIMFSHLHHCHLCIVQLDQDRHQISYSPLEVVAMDVPELQYSANDFVGEPLY